MRIATNLSALSAFASLNSTNKSLQKTINALSTGLRVNSAADDAAGFAISEKMRSQISGLDIALRNSQDGISLLQTAEGALSQTNSMLQRMRELSVQASNDSLTSIDRQYIQLEVDDLKKQIDRIADTTQFNKKRLLDGSCGALWSSDDSNVNLKINGGLTFIDEFGQKVSSEGNYRIEVRAEAGEAQVQKSNIMYVSKITVTSTEKQPDIETIDISTGKNTKTGATSGDGWNFDSATGVLTITGTNVYKITGTTSTNRIVINSGVHEDEETVIILSDTNIDVSNTNGACAFDMTGSKVDLYLEGDNVLRSGSSRAGLEVPDGAELTLSSIEGDLSKEGKLTSEGGECGSGIGGPGFYAFRNGPAGIITINGGTITAVGAVGAAGIGGGCAANNGGGTITINGGNITAIATIDSSSRWSYVGGAGIGSGDYPKETDPHDETNITIRGGTINAKGGYMSAGIGGGRHGDSGEILIGPRAVINAEGDTANGAENIGHGSSKNGTDVKYVDIYPPEPRESAWIKSSKSSASEDERFLPLSEISKFYNTSGTFLVSQPQTLTITQGDGQTAPITLYSTDTMYDVAEKINNVIAHTFGNARYTNNHEKFCTIAEGTEGTSESVYVREPVYDDDGNITGYNIHSTMLVRSAIPGKAGELYFSGDEDLLNALGLNTIQESSESTFTASVYDAHSGNKINDMKTTGSEFRSIIPPEVDVELDSMAGLKSSWDENTKRFVLSECETYSAFIHLKDNGITFQTGANQREDFMIQLGDTSSHALGISGVSVVSRETASRAISTIDRAISKVSSQRAKIGSYENALEHTISNLTTTSMNLTSAESRIRDADMSKLMMNFVKLQILNQSGTSMLAQANQLPQSVLSLMS